MATWECTLSAEAERKVEELAGRGRIPVRMTIDAPQDADPVDVRRQAFEMLLAKVNYWGGDVERADLMALANERHMRCIIRPE